MAGAFAKTFGYRVRFAQESFAGDFMIDVVMPQMGESIVEGTLTRWLKKPGETGGAG